AGAGGAVRGSGRAGAMRGLDVAAPVSVADRERRQLEVALRPSAMAGPLAAALHRAGLAPANGRPACHILDVKYVPGETCQILYELGERLVLGALAFGSTRERTGQTGGWIAPPGMPIYFFPADPAMPGLATALRPEKVAGFLPDLPMVVQEPLAGVPLDLLLDGRTTADPRGQSGVVMAASALADLHGLDVRHPRVRSVGDELRRMAQRSRSAAAVDPELGARMADLARSDERRLEQLSLESRQQHMVHADCKPSQFLIDGTKVGLLDFDHAGMADPALDVGTFMASLRQLGWRPSPKARRSTHSNMDGSMRDLERSFLDSYCQG